MQQVCMINGWHPALNPNQRSAHWGGTRAKQIHDRDTACGALCFAKWQPVEGRARLLVELVYPVNRLPDKDNAYARCKGAIDAVHPHKHWVAKLGVWVACAGFVKDDSDKWLDIEVRPVYEKGTKAVRMTLEAVA